MQIEEIYIYGYGKFEDTKFTNLHKKQIFFGRNEAGKSTIMSFIHSVLFGFPTKQQSDLRYEPKKGAKYGGQLTILFSKHGRTVIERVKGKATGDCSVRLESGEIGGEELLKSLLSSIDKHLYTSIFSFNLHGLQNIHQMKEQDLGRFLFSIGTVGTDQLLKAENELSKELDARFKSNGRNPYLNVSLKELQQLRNELRKAESQNDQYMTLLQKRDSIETQIQKLKATSTELSRKKAKIEEWQKLSPLFEQEKVLHKELVQYDGIIFPDKGLETLEQLTGTQTVIERKIHTLEQRLQRLKEELLKLKPDFTILEKENEINTIVENLPLLEKTKQEQHGLGVNLKKVEEEILFLQNKIHLPLTDQDILTINTSIFMKEKASDLYSKQKSLFDKKLELDQRFHEEKTSLEELELKEETIKKELIPEFERKEIQHTLSLSTEKEHLIHQKEDLEERLTHLKRSHQKEVSRRKYDVIQYSVFAILFVVLCGFGIFSNNLSFLLIGGIGALFSLLSLMKGNISKDIQLLQTEISSLQQKLSGLERDIDTPRAHIELLQQKLEKDQAIRDEINQLKRMIKRQQDNYDHVVDLFEQWEKNDAQLREDLLAVGRELRIPDSIALHYLFDAFQIIDQLKKVYIERDHLTEQVKANEEIMNEMTVILKELSLQIYKDEKHHDHELAFTLKKRLRHELEKQIQYKEKIKQHRHVEEELKDLHLEWEGINKEIISLLTSASAQDVDEFKKIGEKALRKAELLAEYNSLESQLKFSTIDLTEMQSVLYEETGEQLEEVSTEQENLDVEMIGLQEELASVKYKIDMIEEGGTYAELFHRYKQLKSQFEMDAKEWAKYAVAKEILQKTVNNFKEAWFPKMLIKAEEYLHFLTGGHYTRIIPKRESSGFLIESRDQILFEANELSQATMEQIYISIRLALAVTVYEKYKLPIMIDDSFVNFDEMRTKRVIQLLESLESYQILFFTCHQHLLAHFQDAEIMEIEKEKSIQ